MKKLFILFALTFLVFSACKKEAEFTSDENERLNAWFEEKYEELLAMSPLQMTMLGRKDRYDELDDLSKEAEDRMLKWYEASVNEMKSDFDYNALDDDAKISYDLWEYQFIQMKDGLQFRGMSYEFHQMGGIHTQLPSFMINFHRVDSLWDMQAYISRIEQSGRAMNQLLDRARSQAAKGISTSTIFI
jgi:uncharacterized protein (DUF885 family)